MIDPRRNFFTDSTRRTMIAASVTDRAWTAEVASHATGPYLFVASAIAAQRLPQAEGYRLSLLCLPCRPQARSAPPVRP